MTEADGRFGCRLKVLVRKSRFLFLSARLKRFATSISMGDPWAQMQTPPASVQNSRNGNARGGFDQKGVVADDCQLGRARLLPSHCTAETHGSAGASPSRNCTSLRSTEIRDCTRPEGDCGLRLTTCRNLRSCPEFPPYTFPHHPPSESSSCCCHPLVAPLFWLLVCY